MKTSRWNNGATRLELNLDWQAFDVPEQLRTQPGAPGDENERRFFDWAFPEEDFFGKGIGRGFINRLTADEPYRRIRSKYEEAINTTLAACKECQNIPATGTPTGEDITEAVRSEARRLGIPVIGFTAFDRSHVYGPHRREVRYRNIVIAGIEHAFDETNTATPSELTHDLRVEVGIESARRALKLADFIRLQGYPVQIVAGPIGLDLVKIIPYGVAAGLGQLGANGQLLSPYFGSNWWPIAMSTDAPLTHGKPIDFGIPALCEECQVCVRRCPGRAIPKQRVNWRGVLKHRILPTRCLPMLERYEMCAVCIKVCPVQRFGLKPVLDHYSSTGEVLGKGTDELEAFSLPDKGYFPVGEMPRFTKSESIIDYETAAEQNANDLLFGLNE